MSTRYEHSTPVKLIVRKSFKVFDASDPATVNKFPVRIGEKYVFAEFGNHTLEPGEYEMERIPNPVGIGLDWFVVKGTLIGFGLLAWEKMPSELGELITK